MSDIAYIGDHIPCTLYAAILNKAAKLIEDNEIDVSKHVDSSNLLLVEVAERAFKAGELKFNMLIPCGFKNGNLIHRRIPAKPSIINPADILAKLNAK